MVVVDHVTAGGGVWARPLGLDQLPRLAQRLGEVVVHRAGDGHRVGLGRLCSSWPRLRRKCSSMTGSQGPCSLRDTEITSR